MFHYTKVTLISLTIDSQSRSRTIEVPVTTDIEVGRRWYINTRLHDFEFLLISQFSFLVATHYIFSAVSRVSTRICVWTTIEHQWEVSGTTLSVRIRVNRDKVVNIVSLYLAAYLAQTTVVFLVIRVSIITIRILPTDSRICNRSALIVGIVWIVTILHFIWPRTTLSTRVQYSCTCSLEFLAQIHTLPEVGVRLVETECIWHTCSRQVRIRNSSHRTVVWTIATVTWVDIDAFACQVSS